MCPLTDPNEETYPTLLVVYCDDCGLQEFGDFLVHVDDDPETRFGYIRRHLADNKGWLIIPMELDLCPECGARELEAQQHG